MNDLLTRHQHTDNDNTLFKEDFPHVINTLTTENTFINGGASHTSSNIDDCIS